MEKRQVLIIQRDHEIASLGQAVSQSTGLLARLSALESLQSRSPSLTLIEWSLNLLFTFIQLLPVILAFLLRITPPTTYERLLRVNEEFVVSERELAGLRHRAMHSATLRASSIEQRIAELEVSATSLSEKVHSGEAERARDRDRQRQAKDETAALRELAEQNRQDTANLQRQIDQFADEADSRAARPSCRKYLRGHPLGRRGRAKAIATNAGSERPIALIARRSPADSLPFLPAHNKPHGLATHTQLSALVGPGRERVVVATSGVVRQASLA